jgi:septal ring factor EnvC (AmiA/AmiB activator)
MGLLPFPTTNPHVFNPTKQVVKETIRVRYRIFLRAVLSVTLISLAAFLGCAAPKPCTVTPVDIEELKSDIRDLDGQIAERKEVLAEVQAELAKWEGQRAEKQAEIPELEAELERAKKASGLTIKIEEAETVEPTAEIDVEPR